MKKKVLVLKSDSPVNLTKDLNKAIHDKQVIDIKFSTALAKAGLQSEAIFAALVIFEDH